MPRLIKAINTDSLFPNINKRGRKFYGANLILVACKKSKIMDIDKANDDFCHYAIKASRRIGKAVVRNKIKRRLRHSIANIAKDDSLIRQFAILIIPKTNCAQMNFQTLQDEIYALFSNSCKNNFKGGKSLAQ